MIWKIATWGVLGTLVGLLLLLMLLPTPAHSLDACETWERGLIAMSETAEKNGAAMRALKLTPSESDAFMSAALDRSVTGNGSSLGLVQFSARPDAMLILTMDPEGCVVDAKILPADMVLSVLAIVFNGDPPDLERVKFTEA